MNSGDTIVAISSATGVAARMIVRTSGADAIRALSSILIAKSFSVEDWQSAEGSGQVTANSFQKAVSSVPFDSAFRIPHSAFRISTSVFAARLSFANLTCPGYVYVFRAPRSYTGEDLVEYHLPGNAILAGLLVSHLVSLGLRHAEAGEFTARAYFNGKLDLTAAEGVAAMVSANSEQEMLAARRLMSGELARRLVSPMDRLTEALALLEVGIDFSDEEVTFLSADQLRNRVSDVQADLRSLLADSGRFERLAHEPTFVLIGRPNAGKSTLLNALAGNARAVTSPIAGTTRDALSAEVSLRRGNCRVLDVAGIEPGIGTEANATSEQDRIDRQMELTARRAIEEADFVLLVRSPDDSLPQVPEFFGRRPNLVVLSKSDLLKSCSDIEQDELSSIFPVEMPLASDVLPVSALTGAGLDLLRDAMDRLAFGGAEQGSRLSINLRHVHAIESAIESLERVREDLALPVELAAAELRDGLSSLGSVLGQVSPDDLLGKVFAKFCIGK